MAIMDRILLHQLDNQEVSKVSEESGVIRFFSSDTLTYITEAINLKQKLLKLYTAREDDLNINELFSKSDYLQIDVTKSAFDALLNVKAVLEKENPEFNQSINSWKEYVYLAINPVEFPYVKVCEFTDEDWFYIGPFKQRFFLIDVMDLMNKLLKLPYCEVKKGPCEKQDMGMCRGWCMLVDSDLAKEHASEEEIERPNIDKLDALLKEAFIHPDNGLLELVQKEKDKYENDLQFIKADLLSPQLALLKRYKQWLIFLYQAKNLNMENDGFKIQNGQLVNYVYNGIKYEKPYVNIAYRPNEILALNKNFVDEAWILYQESL